MRTHKASILMAAIAVTLAIAAPTFFAQSSQILANVPFDFYVADRLLPAGSYRITPHGNSNAVHVTDNRGNSVFVMSSIPRDNRNVHMPRLVFHRYGDLSFLSSIYWEGFMSGRDVKPSKMETRLAQNGAPVLSVAVMVK